MKQSSLPTERRIYLLLWLPILLAPLLYAIATLIVDTNVSERWDAIHFVMFITPFAVLFAIHQGVLVRHFFMRGRMKAYIIGAVALLAVFIAVNATFIHPIPKHDSPELKMPRHKMNMRPPAPRRGVRILPLGLDIMIAILLMGSNLSVAYYVKYTRERQRNSEIENQRKEQELEYLKAQLKPHFLMNMLNNIHSLVETDPQEAQTMIMKLSKLMRYMLYEGAGNLTLLRDEIEFIANYIDLMRRRYPPKRVSIDVKLPDSCADNIKVPPLLFIVILENAFKHGISYHSHCSLEIGMELTDSRVRLTCSNPVVANNAPTSHGGIGLRNLVKRLNLLYGNDYRYTVTSDGDVYSTILEIPYQTTK